MDTINNISRQRAEKRVEELRGFYVHCIVYAVVNGLLFCLNYFQSLGHWWFQWPLLGWGIGLVMNGLGVWKNGLFGEVWKERKVEQLMRKEQ